MFAGGLPPPTSSQPFLCLLTCQAMLMQCQAATLNTFKLMLMAAQSQGLSLHPLDLQFCLGNSSLQFCLSVFSSFHPTAVFHVLSSSVYPFVLFLSSAPLAFSISFLQSLFSSIFTGGAFGCSRFCLSPVFDFFFLAKSLIKRLQKSKFDFLNLCSHLPNCVFFLVASLQAPPPSLLHDVCTCSAETERSPWNSNVWAYVNKNERKREWACKPRSPFFASFCH